MSAELARLLALVADDLEHRHYQAAGIVHHAAQVLATMTPTDSDACPVCGGPVAQPATGRRRVYCRPACRHRAAKQRRNGEVVT